MAEPITVATDLKRQKMTGKGATMAKGQLISIL
jgi:hypothetical protein